MYSLYLLYKKIQKCVFREHGVQSAGTNMFVNFS